MPRMRLRLPEIQSSSMTAIPAVLGNIPEMNMIRNRSLLKSCSSPNINMSFNAKEEEDGVKMLRRKTTAEKEELSRISRKMSSFGESLEVGDWKTQSSARCFVPLAR